MAADLARDDLELRRLVLRASILPVLVMAAVGGVLVWQVVSLRRLAAGVDHTNQVIARVGVVTRLMIDHEDALRGYLLTRREDFLGPYLATEKDLEPALDALEALVSDNPGQLDRARRLRVLADAWRAIAGDLPRRGTSPEPRVLVENTLALNTVLDEVRDESARFVAVEEWLRTERVAHAQRAARGALLSAIPALLILGVVFAALARRQMRRVAAVYRGTARAAALRADLLAESEERFRLFVEGLRDAAVYVLDPEGQVRSWNLGAERIEGYRPDEVIGSHFGVFYTAEDVAAGHPERELAEAAAKGQVESEGWRVRKDGSRFWAEVTMRALRAADHRILGYAKLVRDTTERKRAEMRRAAQYGVARALAEAPSIDEALVPLLAEIGAILGYELALAWIPEGEALRVAGCWNRPSAEADWFVGRMASAHLGRGERMAGMVWSSGVAAWVEDGRREVARGLTPLATEAGFFTGLAFPVSVGTSAGARVAMVIQLLARDPRERDTELLQVAMTLGVQIGAYLERQRAQEEARAAAQLRAEELERRVQERTVELTAVNRELEAFSYSVSHDLRAPLRAMDGFSQVLLDDYADQLDATARDYIARIRAGSQRMSTLIDDLIQLSRVTRSELKRDALDLSALFREVVAEVQDGEPARQVEVVVAEGVRARGDARLLRVGLSNVVGNAFKFTRNQPHPRVEFGVERRDGGRVYYVRDNGAGFDMAYAEKLFQPFQRLHSSAEFEGTGIGLATWQRIVQRHGGRVWAESSPGEGATFLFTLGEY